MLTYWRKPHESMIWKTNHERGEVMKTYSFTVDDNIRFLKELTQQQPGSIFCHPYPAMYRKLHEKYGVKVQLNLFYEMDGFDLSQMTDRYRQEWEANAHWLKLSFHAKKEFMPAYDTCGYEEVFRDCLAVEEQILRFAGEESLARTTTVHFCKTSEAGVLALRDRKVAGLLGYLGTDENPRVTYSLPECFREALKAGQVIRWQNVSFAVLDIGVDGLLMKQLVPSVESYLGREQIRVMVHEQYFYPDYKAYQPDYGEKLDAVFEFLQKYGYTSLFFEEMI